MTPDPFVAAPPAPVPDIPTPVAAIAVAVSEYPDHPELVSVPFPGLPNTAGEFAAILNSHHACTCDVVAADDTAGYRLGTALNRFEQQVRAGSGPRSAFVLAAGHGHEGYHHDCRCGRLKFRDHRAQPLDINIRTQCLPHWLDRVGRGLAGSYTVMFLDHCRDSVWGLCYPSATSLPRPHCPPQSGPSASRLNAYSCRLGARSIAVDFHDGHGHTGLFSRAVTVGLRGAAARPRANGTPGEWEITWHSLNSFVAGACDSYSEYLESTTTDTADYSTPTYERVDDVCLRRWVGRPAYYRVRARFPGRLYAVPTVTPSGGTPVPANPTDDPETFEFDAAVGPTAIRFVRRTAHGNQAEAWVLWNYGLTYRLSSNVIRVGQEWNSGSEAAEPEPGAEAAQATFAAQIERIGRIDILPAESEAIGQIEIEL